MIFLKFFLIFVDSVAVINISFEVILFLLEFILILLLFFLAQGSPVVFDHSIDISRAGVLVLFLVLGVSFLEETCIWSQCSTFSCEFLILFVETVSFSEPNVVNLLVVVLFVIRKALPFLCESFGELVPLASAFGSFLARPFEEEAHVGIHGRLGGLQVSDAKALFEVSLVLFEAVLVSLHEKIDY